MNSVTNDGSVSHSGLAAAFGKAYLHGVNLADYVKKFERT